MKKALALSAFALVMALPLVSSAASITNSFLTSSTASSTIGISDTIQFEITITLEAVNFDTVFWEVSGDVVGALASTGNGSNWAGANNIVTNYEWAYAVGNKVDMGTNGRFVPFPAPFPVGNPVAGPYGFFAQGGKTGDTIPSLVGTVTIHANAAGAYQGGGFLFPTIDGFLVLGVEQPVTITGGAFTVTAIPEPGTAVLMLLGLGGLGMMGRKSR